METPSRHSFDLNGSTVVFPIPSTLRGDNYVRVEVDSVFITASQFDIVNNSIVFMDAADVPSGSQLDVYVVQTDEAIGQLGNSTAVESVASNIADVTDVANSLNNINSIANNLTEVLQSDTYAANASASATAAANSAASAASSAATATAVVDVVESNASAASASATAASESASAASTSAATAATAATTAESAKTATENLFNQFGDKYLGSHANDTAVATYATANGYTLDEGDVYWDSANNVLKFYTGSAWVAPEDVASTAATNASNSATAAALSEASAAASAITATNQASASSGFADDSAASAVESANSASASAGSASSAATSATNSANSATASATSADEAQTSATNASNSATAAATSASGASASQTAAAGSADDAALSASAASTSATEAATSATASDGSASTATTQAGIATTQATNAAGSATAAAASAAAAAISESNIAGVENAVNTVYDQFDDRYLGAKSIAPTVDNDGDPLLTGAIYWNTTNNQLYIWNGSAWDAAAFSASGTVTSFNTRVGAVTLNNTDVTNAVGQAVDATGTPTFASLQLSGGVGGQGTMSWNADEETLDLIQNGATLQLGQETQLHVTLHSSAATIANGEAVAAVGTTGGSGKVLVCKASVSEFNTCTGQSVTELPAKYVIGVATETITNNGKVTNFGKINDVSGASYTQGAVYYVDDTTGGLTSTVPTSGLVMPIAFAINSDTLMVRTTPINERFIEEGATAYSWGNHALAGYQAASTALTTSTSFGGDVSGTYNAIVVADDSHNHVISNVDGLQAALDGKVDDSQVLTNVPAGAVFTDTVYSHPSYAGDDINLDTGALSGATVISDLDFNITTDTLGHVTDANATYSTRNLTYSDVGAASASHTHSYLPLSGGTLTGTMYGTTVDLSSSVKIGSEVVLQESTDRADLLQITSTASSWAGLQIRNSSNEGRWSFMTDGNTGGFYDDENNDWAIQMLENSEVRLYHNGAEKLNTRSDGIDITGSLYINGSAPSFGSPPPTIQTFTASGTWTKPSGCKKIRVTVLGGGGGGGRDADGGDKETGGGGGAGGLALSGFINVTSVSSVAVTVGAGGGQQSAGGTSSFGSYCSATGGGAGASGPTENVQAGGTGGVATGGIINISYFDGKPTVANAGNSSPGADGANSPLGFGAGGYGAPIVGNGENAAGYGAGGGGGGSGSSSFSSGRSTGGSGSSGLVLIEEFY